MLKRMHTKNRARREPQAKGAVVYRFPITHTVSTPERAPAAAVYWTRKTTVELYPFDAAYLSRLRSRDAETEAHFVPYFDKLLKIKIRSDGYFEPALGDIKQETLLRVLRAVYDDKIQNPASLRSFVYGVCANVENEYDRDGRRMPLEDSDEFPDLADERYSADDGAYQAEIRDIVRRVLSKLSAREQKVLISVFMDEKDKDELCRDLRIDREYLRVLVHRALANARKLLGGNDKN